MTDFKDISRDELKKWMNEGSNFVLIDVLGEGSYEAQHLPGAVNVPGGDDFEKRAAKVAPDKEKPVVVYCSSFDCQASPRAADKLAKAGYENVYDFRGGLADWRDARYDMITQQ